MAFNLSEQAIDKEMERRMEEVHAFAKEHQLTYFSIYREKGSDSIDSVKVHGDARVLTTMFFALAANIANQLKKK